MFPSLRLSQVLVFFVYMFMYLCGLQDLAFLYIRSCLDGKLVQHPNAADRVEANSFIRPARVPLVRHELITFIFIWSPKVCARTQFALYSSLFLGQHMWMRRKKHDRV